MVPLRVKAKAGAPFGAALTRAVREICPAGLDISSPLCYHLCARLAAAPPGATSIGVHGAREKPLGLIDQAAFFTLRVPLQLCRKLHPLLAPAAQSSLDIRSVKAPLTQQNLCHFVAFVFYALKEVAK